MTNSQNPNTSGKTQTPPNFRGVICNLPKN